MSITRFEVVLDLDGEQVPMAQVETEERRARTVRTDFRYRRDYLARNPKLALDPATPVNAADHTTEELPRGLSDAGPDGWGRRLLLRAHRGRELTPSDFLLGVGDLGRIGALRFRLDPDGPFVAGPDGPPKTLPMADLVEAAHAVESDPDDLAAVRDLLDVGSGGLGGVRPKAAIDRGGRLLIAKFPSTTDEIEVVAWEKLCLDLAADAGISVPPNRLEPAAGVRVLVLERFDRSPAGHRIPYLSAFSLTEVPYADAGDYTDIGAGLAELDSVDLPSMLAELWRRAAFNVAMRNTDDHLKNHGVLWSPEGWRLSPAFDIAPGVVAGMERATAIAGEDAPAREARGLRSLADAFGMHSGQATEIARQVLTTVSNWKSRAAALALAEREIERLSPQIEEAQSRLAAAADSW